MPLTMLPTGLASPAYQDWQDWAIYADGEPVGRIYEDSSRGTSADLRWFWSITTYVQPVSHEREGANARPGEGRLAQLDGLRQAARELAVMSPTNLFVGYPTDVFFSQAIRLG
jgi:hypothetical protein